MNTSLPFMSSLEDCVHCSAGAFCGIGSVNETACAVGTFNPFVGRESCLRCEEGMFADSEGLTACRECEPGQWCSAEMSIPCSFDTYNPLPKAYLSTNCTRCPERTSTRVLPVIDGRASLDECKCDIGYWQAPIAMDVASIESCQQGQGVTALLKFDAVMFQEGDHGPGRETGRKETLSVEVGVKGDEHDFRCLGRSGVMMADREDPIITVQVQPPGMFVNGQLDIIFAITKGGMHCIAPSCSKRVDPWTLTRRNDLPIYSRIEHRVDHGGRRGAAGANNIRWGFVCAACERQRRA